MKNIHAQAESNTGGDLLNVVYDEVKQLKAENAALIAALKELIPIAEDYAENLRYEWAERKATIVESAIENAKSLITPQKEQTPQ